MQAALVDETQQVAVDDGEIGHRRGPPAQHHAASALENTVVVASTDGPVGSSRVGKDVDGANLVRRAELGGPRRR